MAPDAVIWDLDGVIANTASYHFSAWQQVARQRGIAFTKADKVVDSLEVVTVNTLESLLQ